MTYAIPYATYSYAPWGAARSVKEGKLKCGPRVTIYFFGKKKPKSGKEAEMPPGKKVVVNTRTGLPFLKGK